MTNDEKAKAYEMALEAARKELGCDRKEYKVVEQVLKSIFPELRDSEDEDERVRKWLIQYIKDTHPIANYWNGAPTISDVLSWLEKQKEQKPVELSGELSTNDSSNPSGLVARNLTPEQMREETLKPVEWSEEDEKQLDDIISIIRDAYEHGIIIRTRHRKAYSWLNNLRPSWKPTEEQMKALHWARCLIFETYTDKHIATEPYHILGELYDQLKQLKDGTDRKD